MIYDIIGKFKIVFDQLWEGFVVFGFGVVMLKYLDIFEDLFVCDYNILDGGLIINFFQFFIIMISDEISIYYYFIEYLLVGF